MKGRRGVRGQGGEGVWRGRGAAWEGYTTRRWRERRSWGNCVVSCG
ncbi:hypothetical protein Hamer_G011006 [Homarus americanus]|uniref:Uncharacterized protein n=1 Tax=Homarus americanus TaxID=6706 RepID=A0A8J5JXE2_HOMAM|nr:hypothetical protein Hamer_G011006 [Homarus americanus]